MNKAIIDHISPALCTAINPFSANFICSKHHSKEMILSAARRYWRSIDPLLQRMCYNALSTGKKTSKTAPSPWHFITLPEDRATATGNMHRMIGKDRACGSTDILLDRQTRHTHTDMLITIFLHCACGRSKT